MRFLFISLILHFTLQTAYAGEEAENALLQLCDAFGETKAECSCYMSEIKSVYEEQDINMAGSVAKAFMAGQELDAIFAYMLFTRQTSPQQINRLYKVGDNHIKNVGKKCQDPTQKVTPEIKAKRDAMNLRLEKLAARYGLKR